MPPATAPLIVGRDAECAAIQDAFRALNDGQSATLDIAGEAGIGKTSLLRFVEQTAARHGIAVMRGRASEIEHDLPYGVWLDALEHLPHGLDSAEPQLRHVLHRHLRTLLRERAGSRGLLLTLDDLHWADPASIDVIASIVDRGIGAPLILALAHRPNQAGSVMREALLRAAGDTALRPLPLGPLAADDLGPLLPAHLSAREREHLAEQCGGNPLFLTTLLQPLARPRPGAAASGRTPALSSGPSLGSDGRRPPRVPGPQGAGVREHPAVYAALTSELEPLSPPARRLLDAAAVVGDPFEASLAHGLAGTDPADPSALDELIAADLVRPGDGPRWCTFRHPLLHAHVYESTPLAWRTNAHASVAQSLASVGAEAGVTAPHVERSATIGDREAIRTLAAAGRAARGRAPASAAHWLAGAWDLVPPRDRLELDHLLVCHDATTALAVAGRHAEALHHLNELFAALPPGHLARLPVTIGASAVERLLDRAADARVRLTDALADLDASPSYPRAMLLLELGILEAVDDQPGALAARAHEALECTTAIGDPVMVATALSLHALSACFTEAVPESVRRLDAAAAALDAMDPDALSLATRALSMTAEAAWLLQRHGLALTQLERGVVALRDGRAPISAVEALSGQAVALAATGEASRARRKADAALEEARLMTNEQSLMSAHLAVAVTEELTGDPHAAVVAGEQAALHAQRTGSRLMRCFAGQALSRAHIAAGSGDAATATILGTHGGADLPFLPRTLRAESFALLACASAEAGRPGDAEAWVERAHASAEADDLAGSWAFAWLASAARSHASGDHDEALHDARSAAASAETAALPIVAARARILCGRAQSAAGDREGAASTLREAEAACTALGADRLAAEAVRHLRGIGRRVNRRGRQGVTSGASALTARQRQVATLAADGHSNREIAATLFLSQKTIESHLAGAFAALGIASRASLPTALAAWSAPTGSET